MVTLLENAAKIEGEQLKGLVRLRTYEKKPKKSPNSYFGVGSFQVKGGETLQFKIWDETIMDSLEKLIKEYGKSVYLMVSGKGNMYNNLFNVIVDGIQPVDQTAMQLSDFIPVRHDVKELMQRLNNVLKRNVSQTGLGLVGMILNGEIADRFTKEFAGSSMHDAEPLGLLHHTTKMLEITELVMKQHGNFSQGQENVDLVYVGVLIHDIGKILELHDGTYTGISIATHRGLGAELLYGYKNQIVEAYGEMWYYNIIAIIMQHHGKYEERPRTIFSYIVHLIDNFDTGLTIIEEKVKSTDSGGTIKMDEFRLTVEKQSKQ